MPWNNCKCDFIHELAHEIQAQPTWLAIFDIRNEIGITDLGRIEMSPTVFQCDDQADRSQRTGTLNQLLRFAPISMLDNIRRSFIYSQLDGIDLRRFQTAIAGGLSHKDADIVQILELGGIDFPTSFRPCL